MKALVNTPDEPGYVALREVADPQPGPDEAVVRVHASSLNRGELRLLASRPEGWRPGQDIAGVIARAAADGSGPAAGSRVIALAEQAGWAEAVAVPTDRIAVLDDRVGFAEGATLPMAGSTALRTLRLGGNLLGKRVMVTGASGGVGRFQVRLAALQGARVSAVASDRHGPTLRGFGAVEVVPSPAAATGPFDLITESVGGQSLAEAFGRIGPGGTIVAFGLSSGEPTPFAFPQFAGGHEGARIQTFMSYAAGGGLGADLLILADLLANGQIEAEVGLQVPWTDLRQAVEALQKREVAGKAVLHITADATI